MALDNVVRQARLFDQREVNSDFKSPGVSKAVNCPIDSFSALRSCEPGLAASEQG